MTRGRGRLGNEVESSSIEIPESVSSALSEDWARATSAREQNISCRLREDLSLAVRLTI